MRLKAKADWLKGQSIVVEHLNLITFDKEGFVEVSDESILDKLVASQPRIFEKEVIEEKETELEKEEDKKEEEKKTPAPESVISDDDNEDKDDDGDDKDVDEKDKDTVKSTKKEKQNKTSKK